MKKKSLLSLTLFNHLVSTDTIFAASTNAEINFLQYKWS